ncbi:MAG: 2-deoxy-D-gluconate 3-dehydrogenase [Lentisphaerae bacterium RIFOXYB12_FULL_65_16]|nr:MAG: 2-deoxy-D-gluconate 3-dehydrogenase [Lentisphaerae bacterium RIFOXYA12_64_32]OGV90494.1 MAG: 2-deoxy-D-gluconate 3-dehydrogenase [Lentisphaerae bacterium RIFOXYB12_FULL_65_16]
MHVLEQFRLDGRSAVVTGGSRGLGRAMALAFCQAGASVLVCSRHAEEACAVAADIAKATGQRCDGLGADVANPAEVQSIAEMAAERFGRIDVWANSAGINIRHLVEEFPIDEFDRILDVNLRGTWLCCRAVAPILKKQKSGSVINVGSALSVIGLAERTAYCASKAGVLGMTRTLALEWAPFGVRCNAICPGPFLTEINAAIASDPTKAQAVVGQTALKRWGELHEIQGAALFLASEASSYVTGSALFVDGGWTAA